MSAEPFWKLTLKRHHLQKFDSAEQIQALICEYFGWADANPIVYEEMSFYLGEPVRAKGYKKRAYTQAALCAFLGITQVTWFRWRKGEQEHNLPGLSDIIIWADNVCFEQKLTGAAAGIFNPMIISRDLGLSDRQEVKTEATTVVIKGNDAEL